MLWYYAGAEKARCPNPDDPSFNSSGNATEADSNACTIWRRFSKLVNLLLSCLNFENFDNFSLFETVQTLFWAVFGLIDLDSFDLNEIKIFTRFWGMLMFGTYSVINIVVLLNLLIAMMNHSYQLISVSKQKNPK